MFAIIVDSRIDELVANYDVRKTNIGFVMEYLYSNFMAMLTHLQFKKYFENSLIGCYFSYNSDYLVFNSISFIRTPITEVFIEITINKFISYFEPIIKNLLIFKAVSSLYFCFLF